MWNIIIWMPFIFLIILMGIEYIFDKMNLDIELGRGMGILLLLPFMMGWVVLTIIKVFEIINKII